MSHDVAQIERLVSQLEAIRLSAYCMEQEFEAELGKVEEENRESARNLLHYLALRRRDLRALQEELAGLGLSSLGRAESHVLGTVDPVLAVLYRLLGRERDTREDGLRPVHFVDGKAKLLAHTEALFGHPPVSEPRATAPIRIMITMPSEAATDYDLVRDLIENGMNCMRINCAHDCEDAWARMVEHLERARGETGRQCILFMDVAGPKIRTGPVEPGARVIRFEPQRDALGEVIAPALLWLTPADEPEPPPLERPKTIPIDRAVLEQLQPGDRLVFRDARQRSRTIDLQWRSGASWLAHSFQITYLSSDCSLSVQPSRSIDGRELPGDFVASEIPPLEQFHSLTEGDTLSLTADPAPARPVLRNDEGRLVEEPRISCTIPEVFDHVKPGERVLFDDGKIGAVVLSASREGLRLRVTHPVGGLKKLRADKGINLPDSDLKLPALTEKDLGDLDFIVRHADMVGFSFVSRPSDVEQLQREIARRTSRSLGVVLKIETRRAFQQLPRLLLTALRSARVGVMIARGDLAVECGYERLAEVQEEMLWVCEAAHVPVIWATQVLDRLSKKGIPTRAEVTDAAMSERAECVMLNKGPHIVESLRLLREIVTRMQGHQDKKTPRLRPLSISLTGDEKEP